jgi:hypothetical protein
MIRPLAYACIGWQVEAAPLCKLLELVLIHACIQLRKQRCNR